MSTRPSPRARRGVLAWLLAPALLLAGCGGYAPTALPSPSSTASAAPQAAPGEPATCGDPTRSYAPTGSLDSMRDSPTVKDIRDSGKLVVGVSADQYLLGFLNPRNGDLEGFDIDMATYVARAIFGDDGHLDLRVITSADRIPDLMGDADPAQRVDIVARNMTITCDRWTQIAFSAQYYASGQKVLVPTSSEARRLSDLDGQRVCVPAGTTSLDNLRRLAPQAVPVVSTNDAECLVDLQTGRADAVTTDDTVLAGLAAQDPYTRVLTGDPISAEPYGIGVNRDQRDLVRFVNGVLEQAHRDGDWQRSYDRWLGPYLGPGTQPTPVYGR